MPRDVHFVEFDNFRTQFFLVLDPANNSILHRARYKITADDKIRRMGWNVVRWFKANGKTVKEVTEAEIATNI